MIFKNSKQLEESLLNKCKIAVYNVEEKVYDVIDRCLNQFYEEFKPNEYIRTKQLLYSLVKSKVKKIGKGYVAEVYFDVGNINYEQGWVETQSGDWGHASWDKDTIFNVVMTGSFSGKPHGGYAKGTAIWEDSMQYINALGGVCELLVKELKNMGIPIVK